LAKKLKYVFAEDFLYIPCIPFDPISEKLWHWFDICKEYVMPEGALKGNILIPALRLGLEYGS